MLQSGTELHKGFSFTTTVGEQSNVLNQPKLPNYQEALLNYFSGFDQPHWAWVDGTGSSERFADDKDFASYCWLGQEQRILAEEIK